MSSTFSTDRRRWERIFKDLSNILQSQRKQIESLLEDRKYLEKYIHIQHDHWSSETRFLESSILQFRKEEALHRKLHAAKLGLVVETKDMGILQYKELCKLAESDLDDFHACLVALSTEISELKAKLRCRESEELQTLGKSKQSSKRRDQMNESDTTGLIAERDFTWNRLKLMECDNAANLQSKKIEVQNAYKAIEKLKHNLQELQTPIEERNLTIMELKSKHESEYKTHVEEAENANMKIRQLELEKEGLQSLISEKNDIIAKLSGEKSELDMDIGTSGIRNSYIPKENGTKKTDMAHETVQCLSKQGMTSHSQGACKKPVAFKSTGGKAPRRKILSRYKLMVNGQMLDARKINIDMASKIVTIDPQCDRRLKAHLSTESNFNYNENDNITLRSGSSTVGFLLGAPTNRISFEKHNISGSIAIV